MLQFFTYVRKIISLNVLLYVVIFLICNDFNTAYIHTILYLKKSSKFLVELFKIWNSVQNGISIAWLSTIFVVIVCAARNSLFYRTFLLYVCVRKWSRTFQNIQFNMKRKSKMILNKFGKQKILIECSINTYGINLLFNI